MTLFSDILPFPIVLRIWDIFFLDGLQAILLFAISLLKVCEGTLTQKKKVIFILIFYYCTCRRIAKNEFKTDS